MTEIRFNGSFSLPKNLNSKRFIQELSAFLTRKSVVLTGTLQTIDFDDVEIIEETCTNVEQTEVTVPVETAEDIPQ